MEMKAGLTFACMNLKKLAKILAMRNGNSVLSMLKIFILSDKMKTIEKWCLI
jgi:hypothetical protein